MTCTGRHCSTCARVRYTPRLSRRDAALWAIGRALDRARVPVRMDAALLSLRAPRLALRAPRLPLRLRARRRWALLLAR